MKETFALAFSCWLWSLWLEGRNKVCAQTRHANTHTHTHIHCVYTHNNHVQQHVYSIG